MSTTHYDPALAASQQFEVVNAPTMDEPQVVETAPEENSTDSHLLANEDHEEKGAAQIPHGNAEVRDLGWNDHPTDVPMPLVGGLPNEELWTLVRRFNKVDLDRIVDMSDANNTSKCTTLRHWRSLLWQGSI